MKIRNAKWHDTYRPRYKTAAHLACCSTVILSDLAYMYEKAFPAPPVRRTGIVVASTCTHIKAASNRNTCILWKVDDLNQYIIVISVSISHT